jgi:sulfur transfer protein SufE
MKLLGECSEATFNNGIVKVLITIYSERQPEYVLLNVTKERGELEQGKTYRITIEEE